MALSGASPKRQPRRTSVSLCTEVRHLIFLEQKKRQRLGLPHIRQNDIVNEWLLAHGLALGHKPVGDGPE
jgi:hypothetical protein